MDADARFCRHCGKAVAADDSSPAIPPIVTPAVAPVAASARRRGPGRLVGCLVLVVVLIAVAIVGAGLLTAGPADAVTAHLNALAKGDDAGAYGYTATAFRERTSLAAFTTFVNANSELRSGTFTVTDRSVNGDGASVIVELAAAGGAKRTASFSLTKVSDGWRIAGYELGAVGALRATAAAASASGAAAGAAGGGKVRCTSTAQQQPSMTEVNAVAAKARVRLIAGPIDPKDASGNPVSWSAFPETATRAFSLAGLRARTSETVNFLFDAPSVADFPSSDVDMEICDATNMTKAAHTTKPSASSNSAGTRIAMLGNDLPDAPGTGYRVDAYVWLRSTGQWYLVARMTGVSFVP